MRLSLSRVVSQIVLTTLSPLGIYACGGTTASPGGGASSGGASSGVTPTDGMTSACTADGKLIPLLSGVRLAQAADYLGERSESAYEDSQADGGAGLRWTSTWGEETGTRCKGAADVAACNREVDALRLLPFDPQTCFSLPSSSAPGERLRGCATSYLVTTRGAKVATAQADADIAALFGTVDTPEEAIYLATRAGYTASCSEAPLAQYRAVGAGYRLVLQKRDGDCGDGISEAVLTVDAAGKVTEVSLTRVKVPSGCAIGRRPAGLDETRASGATDEIGAFFAQAAHLEAASVCAFRFMAQELRELGASAELLARVVRATRDEVRHARLTARLARRFGARPARVSVAPRAARSAFAIALENATEGCIRETYGAVVATWQAEAASDPEIAEAMQMIARDETEHAQLSWDVAAFLEARLTPEEREQLRQARRDALTQLRAELTQKPACALVREAGLPTSRRALSLLDACEQQLFAAA